MHAIRCNVLDGVFAVLLIGIFGSWFAGIVDRYWREWHAKDEFLGALGMAAGCAFVAGSWLLLARDAKCARRSLLRSSLLAALCVVLVMGFPSATFLWCRHVRAPSDADVARRFRELRPVLESAIDRLAPRLASLDQRPVDDFANGVRFVGRFRQIRVEDDPGLIAAGVPIAYARPDRNWVWIPLWGAEYGAPPLARGVVFHRDALVATVSQVVPSFGNELLELAPLEDHWSLFTAWAFDR